MARKTNKLVLEQIKPEISLEARLTKSKLSYFRYIMRKQGSLKNTIMLGKIESSRNRERANMRWINSIREAYADQGY